MVDIILLKRSDLSDLQLSYLLKFRELQSAQMFLLNKRFREERISPFVFIDGLKECRWHSHNIFFILMYKSVLHSVDLWLFWWVCFVSLRLCRSLCRTAIQSLRFYSEEEQVRTFPWQGFEKKETMKYFPGSRKTWDGHKIRGGNRPSYCFFHPTIGNLNTFMSTVYLCICIVFKSTYGRKSADRTEPDFDVISCVLNILPGIHVFNQKLIVEFDQWYIPPLIFVVHFGKHRWC